jgi:hypothetical protein
MELRHKEIRIEAPSLSTLLWDGDELVDVMSEVRVHINGSITPRSRSAGYPFDRAVGVRQGDVFWSVAYANRATKALLLKDDKFQRELNRSFYFANAYDYPMAITILPNGRVVLIHCPNEYDTLEVEDAETGTTLATKVSPMMEFHSRLAVSPNARYLLDSGWFWHPRGGAWACDLQLLLENREQSGSEFDFALGAEIDSVAFLGDDEIMIASTENIVDEEIPQTGLGPRRLGLWSMATAQWLSQAELSEPCGMLMPWRNWVISFYGHPKAIEIATGKVVHRWDHLSTGKQIGSIDLGDPPPPPIALDPLNGRFAVSDKNGVSIVTLASI